VRLYWQYEVMSRLVQQTHDILTKPLLPVGAVWMHCAGTNNFQRVSYLCASYPRGPILPARLYPDSMANSDESMS
jgi:hypothetical protein